MIRALLFLVVFLALPVLLTVWLVSTLGAIRRTGERTVELLEQMLRERDWRP